MITEFETKVLDINFDEIEKKLIELKAERTEDLLMRRRVFDMESSNEKWIRLRQKQDLNESWKIWKSTITYKLRWWNEIWSTNEIEIKVNDFEKAYELLSKLKRKSKHYQENKRKTYVYNNIEFSIDSWPMIPTYLEVESSSIEKVKEWLKLLWLEWKDNWDLSVLSVYKIYWIDLNSMERVFWKK